MARFSNGRDSDATASGSMRFPKEKSGGGGEQSTEKKRHGVSDNAIQDIELALRQGAIVNPRVYAEYVQLCAARGRTAMPPISPQTDMQTRRAGRSGERTMTSQGMQAEHARLLSSDDAEPGASILDMLVAAATSNDTRPICSDKSALPTADDKTISEQPTSRANCDQSSPALSADSPMARSTETSSARQPQSIWDKWIIQFALGLVGVETMVVYYACYVKAFGEQDICALSLVALSAYTIGCLCKEQTDISQQRIVRFLLGLAQVQAIVLCAVAILWLNSCDSQGNIFFSILVGLYRHGSIWQNGCGNAVNIMVASLVAWSCYGIGFVVGITSERSCAHEEES